MKKKTGTENEFFSDLTAGLAAAIEHAKGERLDLRTTTLPRPPKELSAKQITGVRTKLKMSQAVFARYLNISTRTVQSWEQGLGKPSGASLKLLQIAKRDPRVLLES